MVLRNTFGTLHHYVRRMILAKNWTENFKEALVKYYGETGAVSSANVLIPAIMRDFCSMLKEAEPGHKVSEDYNTEDKKTVIHVQGHRVMSTKGVEFILTAVKVGDENVTLSDEGEDISIFAG